jgi:predicted flap endonuclease-1-like 5' DNA nuclease
MARVGAVVGLVAVIAGLLWLLKGRVSGPPRIPLDEPSPFRPSVPEAAGADDLSEVKGIGPVYAARLADAGIDGFAALAAASAETVAESAGVSERMAIDWISQASKLAGR